jgi:hypothetical protein
VKPPAAIGSAIRLTAVDVREDVPRETIARQHASPGPKGCIILFPLV